MDLSGVAAALSAYPGHVRDVVTFDDLQHYRHTGEFDPDLIWYFAVGLALAVIVGAARRAWVDRSARRLVHPGLLMWHPGVAGRPPARSSSAGAVGATVREMLPTVIIFPAVVGLFHLMILGYHRLYHPVEIGGLADTFNATLAIAAVLAPTAAITGFVQRAAESILQERSRLLARIVAWAAITTLFSVLPGLYIGVAAHHAIASIHGTSMWYMLPPVLAQGLLLFPFVFVAERHSLQTGR